MTFDPSTEFALAPIPRAPRPSGKELTKTQRRVLNMLTSNWQKSTVIARRLRISQQQAGMHLGKLHAEGLADKRPLFGNKNGILEWRVMG